MLKESIIAKVCWDARKSLRPWDGENTLKKWSSAHPPDKQATLNAVNAYLKDRTKPVLKDWNDDEIKLMIAIMDCLDEIVI